MKSIITIKKATPLNIILGIFADSLKERMTIARLTRALNLLNEAYELLNDDWHDDAQDDIQCAIFRLTDDLKRFL